jgi:hypothetical protein
LQGKRFYFFSNPRTVDKQAIGFIDGHKVFVLINDFEQKRS